MSGRSTAAPATDAVRIAKLTVGDGRLTLDVALASDTPRMTDPRLASVVRRRFPALALHTCINNAGPTFDAVLDRTSLPHLLEHLIIDAQVRDAAAKPKQRYVGTTEWTDRAAGIACIQVSFFDDLVALRAVSGALANLSDILSEYENDDGDRR